MLPRPAAMVQDYLVGAACLFQSIGQDRQAVDGTLLLDPFGKRNYRRRPPGAGEGNGPERVAEEIPCMATRWSGKYINPPALLRAV
jgi:hypothetical protein